MEQFNMNEDFRLFQEHQRELASILKDASTVTNGLNMSKNGELSDLSEKVQNDTFKVMVTGTFKNGKSTFINALLGEEILPAYAIPCTAVINEVKYGEEKKAILYFRNPLPETLPDNLADAAVRHMRQYQGQVIPPLEIPYDEIEDYVVIPIGADEKQTKLQSPYEKVELFYPLELLKNGVEIIDSPGLNEDKTRTEVTMEYLPKVDAVLYVLNANAICAGDEMEFVKNDLKGNFVESVFFVVNRFDQIRPKERPQIHQYAKMKLKEFYPDPELYCLSALNALDGRLDQDQEMVEKSGILELEKRLTVFLTKEKGKAKLAAPAKKVRQILSSEALSIVIPRERTLLESSMMELQEKYEAIQPKIQLAVQEKNQKSLEIDSKIERSGRSFERLVKHHLANIANAIPVWMEGYTPKTELGMVPSKEKSEKLIEEISGFLKQQMQENQVTWQQDVLFPEVERVAKEIFDAAEKDFSKIFGEIDAINVELMGGDYKTNPVPFWSRVAGVAGGLVLGDLGLAFSGGVNGLGKEFAKTAVFEIGAGVVLALLGLLNPFTLIAMFVAVTIFNIGAGANKATKKLKEQITTHAVEAVTNSAEEQAQAIAANIIEKLTEVKNQIIDSISGELSDLEGQMQSILDQKQSGEASVQARKDELKGLEDDIHDLNARLDTLIFALLG